jgi:hypothetical protein
LRAGSTYAYLACNNFLAAMPSTGILRFRFLLFNPAEGYPLVLNT